MMRYAHRLSWSAAVLMLMATTCAASLPNTHIHTNTHTYTHTQAGDGGNSSVAGETCEVAPDGVVCEGGVCRLATGSFAEAHGVNVSRRSASFEQQVLQDYAKASGVDLNEASIETRVSESTHGDDAEQMLSANMEAKVDELVKLGWDETQARRALAISNNDVLSAAEALALEDEEEERVQNLVTELTSQGWDQEAALTALRECGNNVTAASELLLGEESSLESNFENAVKDMTDNGWDEVVARQALLAQWSLDQHRAQTRPQQNASASVGDSNATQIPMSEAETRQLEELRSIRPTLKARTHTHEHSEECGADCGHPEHNHKHDHTHVHAPVAGSTGKPKLKQPESKIPAVSKADVVFDIGEKELQRLVMESPVPVVLDIYADWCGPCKALGPALEDAAVKLGGAVRVVKVNSDNNRRVVEALRVQGLPTVYAFANGTITDKFTGLVPQEQFQNFFIRMLTGMGPAVGDLDESTRTTIARNFAFIAGDAALDSSQSHRIYSAMDVALDRAAETPDSVSLLKALTLAKAYILKAIDNIGNQQYRCIRRTSKAFSEVISLHPAVVNFLKAAGFMESNTDGDLELVHRNVAILGAAEGRLKSVIDKLKYKTQPQEQKPAFNPPHGRLLRKKPTPKSAHVQADPPVQMQTAQQQATKQEPEVEPQSTTPTNSQVRVMLRLLYEGKDGGATKRLRTDGDVTLEELITDSGVTLSRSMKRGGHVIVRYPLPTRTTTLAEVMETTISDLAQGGNELDLALTESDITAKSKNARGWFKKRAEEDPQDETDETNKSVDGPSITQRTQSKRKQASGKRGTHTLISSGILSSKKKKNNEYFGGDSTVVVGGDEEEEEEEED